VGVMQPGRGSDHRISSSTEIKERVELYLYSPSPSVLYGRLLSHLYLIIIIIIIIAGNVARRGEREVHTEFWWGT